MRVGTVIRRSGGTALGADTGRTGRRLRVWGNYGFRLHVTGIRCHALLRKPRELVQRKPWTPSVVSASKSGAASSSLRSLSSSFTPLLIQLGPSLPAPAHLAGTKRHPGRRRRPPTYLARQERAARWPSSASANHPDHGPGGLVWHRDPARSGHNLVVP